MCWLFTPSGGDCLKNVPDGVTGQHTPQMNAESAQRRVLASYVTHYNRVRPHQGLDQQTPVPSVLHDHAGPVRRRDVLGGLIHEYDRAAA